MSSALPAEAPAPQEVAPQQITPQQITPREITAQEVTRSARRLGTMLRHSTHLFFALLWAVAMLPALHAAPLAPATLGGWWILLCYLAGLGFQSARPGAARRPRAGRIWVGLLVASWAVLAGLAQGWLWLCFPLFFLVLFIVPRPAAWVVVAVMALWAAASPLARSEAITPGGVLGPAFGAGVAVIGWLVIQQLMRDAAEQRRLAEEVTLAHEQILDQAREQARTTEREELARDLHDSLAQGLNSIVLLARAAAARHPQAAPDLALIEQAARENLVEARAMVRRMASAPQGASLVERLGELVASTAGQLAAMGSPLRLEHRVDGTPRPVDDLVARTVLQSTRASLANVVQHSGAGRCVVSLGFLPDEVTLDIVDDGVGFAEGSRREDSFGLRALAGRIAQAGGILEVDSAPGQGTSIGIRLPAPAGAAGHQGREDDDG